ncbi:MAG: methionyl-tRNA formyltransferase [Deltaproteobacteria bacterium]
MRIVFMGTPEFAVPSLTAMLAHGEEVVAVVTQPDRPRGRGRKVTPSPVKTVAEKAGLEVLQPTRIKTEEFLDQLRAYRPDLIVVTAYGRILPKALIELPTHGTINVHASLLPKYRGAAPIQWAVINCEKETGVTIMQMDEGLDTGDILLPGRLSIDEDDTAGSLAEKLSGLGGRLLTEALDLLKKGKLLAKKQDESQATFAPLLDKEQGRIQWEMPAARISCLIRGLDPWPSAYTFLGEERFRFFRPQVLGQTVNAKPGTLVGIRKDGLQISTGDGLLTVAEVQREGSRRMPVSAFLQGHPLAEGELFG